MTDDEKILKIVQSLTVHALGDIKRASSGGCKLGAFILSSCLIDAMAGFVKGQDTIRKDYINFVTRYMPAYDGNKLYYDLRCKLVHSYSVGGSYIFLDAKPEHHMKISGTKIIINLENFVSDVENALKKFCKRLQNPYETQLRLKALKRLDNNGIVGVVELNMPDTEARQ